MATTFVPKTAMDDSNSIRRKVLARLENSRQRVRARFCLMANREACAYGERPIEPPGRPRAQHHGCATDARLSSCLGASRGKVLATSHRPRLASLPSHPADSCDAPGTQRLDSSRRARGTRIINTHVICSSLHRGSPSVYTTGSATAPHDVVSPRPMHTLDFVS